MEIDKKLYADIKEYCQLNGLKVKDFINDTLKRAFMAEKYGKTPFVGNRKFEQEVEKEIRTIIKDEDKLNEVIKDQVEEIVGGPVTGKIEMVTEPENLDKNQDKVTKSEQQGVKVRPLKTK